MRRFVCLVACLALGCQDYLFEQKCPQIIKEQEISRAAAEPRPADILFIVDNSASMADEQENLANNFDAFIQQVAGAGDYRIAVVTTDQTNNLEREGLRLDEFITEPGTGVPAFSKIGDDGCSVTSIPQGCFRGPDPATRIIDSSTMDAATQIAAFKRNVRVGSCGSGREEGLKAMISSLSLRGGCNGGFLRDEANLVVIIVSDEDNQSADVPRSFLELLKRAKPIERIRLAMIVGSVDSAASNCRTGIGATCGSLCTSGVRPAPDSGRMCNATTASAVCDAHEYCGGGMCKSSSGGYWDADDAAMQCANCAYFNAPDCCTADAGDKYVRFAQIFEEELNQVDPTLTVTGCRPGDMDRTGCLLDSICQESFAATLSRIARDLVIATDFILDPPAINTEGIRARIVGGRFGEAGLELVPGEDFTVTPTSLKLEKADKVPAPDEKLEIYYVSEVIDATQNPRGACGI